MVRQQVGRLDVEMRVKWQEIVIFVLLSVMFWMVLTDVSASDQSSKFLPVVQGTPFAVPTTCDASAPILDQDTGALSAEMDIAGRFIIAYQDRAHGSLIHVAQHVGAGLVDLPGPTQAVSAVVGSGSPSFSPPGPKQGPMSLVSMGNGKSRMYYTQRKSGDETGPYGIWCLEF